MSINIETLKVSKTSRVFRVYSGEGGIRTHGDPKATTVFETVPFNRSGTSPCGGYYILIF